MTPAGCASQLCHETCSEGRRHRRGPGRPLAIASQCMRPLLVLKSMLRQPVLPTLQLPRCRSSPKHPACGRRRLESISSQSQHSTAQGVWLCPGCLDGQVWAHWVRHSRCPQCNFDWEAPDTCRTARGKHRERRGCVLTAGSCRGPLCLVCVCLCGAFLVFSISLCFVKAAASVLPRFPPAERPVHRDLCQEVLSNFPTKGTAHQALSWRNVLQSYEKARSHPSSVSFL